MGDAKRIIVKPIAAADAARIVKALHYSGKVVQNSQVHLGVFLDGKCGGAMQFGPSLDKRKIQGLVRDTKWNEFIELNRMAFADWLPRNGESRAIGFAMRWLKKTYPWLQWVISFADGTQCGDGTIYRASGFVLTGLSKNKSTLLLPDGSVIHEVAAKTNSATAPQLIKANRGGMGTAAWKKYAQAKPLPGYQLRYIYFLDPTARERLTVPVLPFKEIDKRGAGMYKGKQRVKSCAGSETLDTPATHAGKGGSLPTPALHS